MQTFQMVIHSEEHLKWLCFDFLFKGKEAFFSSVLMLNSEGIARKPDVILQLML